MITAPNRLRLASFPHVSYLPQYVAEALGYFEQEGVAVAIAPHAGAWTTLIEAAGAGGVDLIVGNIWFALRQADSPSPLLPVAHCLRETRFLLYRHPDQAERPFDWRQLEGAALLVPSEVPTPWIALREVLERRGLRFDRVRTLTGFPARDAAAEVARGAADFALLGIEEGVRAGLDQAAALAETLGPVPWSVYLASARELAARPVVYAGFRRAIARALAAVQRQSAAELAALVAPWFSGTDPVTLGRTIERYQALAAWPATAELDPEHVARWQDVLLRWGLLPQPVDWQPLLRVINRSAD